jgi:membrane AbrB-like protein
MRVWGETLAWALAGGLALAALGLPAAWLSGALIAVAGAVLAGRPLALPRPLGHAVFLLLGISMGAAVTPATLSAMALWPLSIAALLLAMGAVTGLSTLYLMRVHGWPRAAAIYATVPGALSQVLVMASSAGVDVRAVATVQTLRVMILSALLPGALALAGLAPVAAPSPAALPWTADRLMELALLMLAAGAAGLVFHRLRFPGGLLVGALLASAILHGSALVQVNLPQPLLLTCFVVLGAMMGLRFAGTEPGVLRGLLAAALGAFAVAVAASAMAAALVSWALALSPADVVVAFAPGALEVMMILAFAMHLDVAYVGAHHLARFIAISFGLPLLRLRTPHKSISSSHLRSDTDAPDARD